MAHKHKLLHELLKEEQEPFHLNTYIADKCSQLRKSSLQIKKRKPIIHTSPIDLRSCSICKNACLFSFQNSPNFRKSPFQSPYKSPNRAVILPIPARTAALLVEAAMRIQTKQSKRKTQTKNVGFGLFQFGSIFKMLKDCTKNKRRMLGDCDNQVEISRENETKIDEKMEMDIRFSCSYDNWSASNEEKSMDLETSTSSCSEYVAKGRANINGDFASCENRFCSSPFRFSLQKCPSSSGCRTPDFSSPEASPSRPRKGKKVNCGTKSSEEILEEEEEKEEKDHFSPVSVLDPTFEEDNGQERADADEDGYDLECSYVNVQRAKQQLLDRLCRFEKLAELDPIELERNLLEESDDDDQVEREECKDDEPFAMYRERSVDTFASEVFTISRLQKTRKIPTDMKRLVSDLIVEQKSQMNCSNNSDQVVFDTVGMMIELAFQRESNRWTKFREQEEETAAEIEVGIFGLLVAELSEELLLLTWTSWKT